VPILTILNLSKPILHIKYIELTMMLNHMSFSSVSSLLMQVVQYSCKASSNSACCTGCPTQVTTQTADM